MTTRDDLDDRTVVAVADPDDPPAEMAVVPPDEAGLSVLDRGFLYGDAAFETLRCYDGEPAFLAAHADRLRATLERLSIPYRPSDADLRARVDRLLAGLVGGEGGPPPDGATGGDPAPDAGPDSAPDTDPAADADPDPLADPTPDAYVRVSVTRGRRAGLLAPTETDPTLVAVATGLSTRRYDPAAVETVAERRHDAALYRHKTHNYLPGVLAKGEAGAGADEALLCDADGAVASGAVSNVFALRDGRLSTPDGPVRPGVTRERVLDVAEELGIDTRRGSVGDLAAADAAFLTNSTWGVRPVRSVDGRPVGSAPAVERIAEAYFERAVP